MASKKKYDGDVAEAPAYEMPAVEVGDVVLWHPLPDEEAACAGVVTEVAGETVSLSLVHRNFYNMEPKDGVRHKDHPDRALILSTESGCWTHTPRRVETERLLREISAACFGTSVEA